MQGVLTHSRAGLTPSKLPVRQQAGQMRPGQVSPHTQRTTCPPPGPQGALIPARQAQVHSLTWAPLHWAVSDPGRGKGWRDGVRYGQCPGLPATPRHTWATSWLPQGTGHCTEEG